MGKIRSLSELRVAGLRGLKKLRGARCQSYRSGGVYNPLEVRSETTMVSVHARNLKLRVIKKVPWSRQYRSYRTRYTLDKGLSLVVAA